MSLTKMFLLQGFSPAYTELTASKLRILAYIKKDANNYWQLNFDNSTKKFNLIKCVGGTLVPLSSIAQTFLKNQIFSIGFGQTSTGMALHLLKNNGAKESYSNTDTTSLTGSSSLYLLTKDTTGNESDAFASRIIFLPNYVPSDAVAEDMLRGNVVGLAGGGFAFPTMTGTVKLLPNNKYTLVGTGTLYCNALQTRTVTAGDIVTSAVENKIILDGASTIKLKM